MGDLGEARYRQRLAPLMAIKPAYDQHDEALALARKGDLAGARRLAAEAAKRVPAEGRFPLLQGDLALAAKEPAEALRFYEKSLALDDSYFAAHLGAGVAQYQLGTGDRGEARLTRSAELLPTAPALFYLGNIAKAAGNREKAMALFKGAAGSKSDLGRQAAVEFVRLDFPENGTKYVAAGFQLDARGNVMVVVENRAPFPVSRIVVTPVLVDGAGRVIQQGRSVQIRGPLAAGQRASVNGGFAVTSQEMAQALRMRVDGVRGE